MPHLPRSAQASPAPQAQAAGAVPLELRQALFGGVVFIDEFEFVLAKMAVI
jgi:hypothetical protein